jgi:hypothetical protein
MRPAISARYWVVTLTRKKAPPRHDFAQDADQEETPPKSACRLGEAVKGKKRFCIDANFPYLSMSGFAGIRPLKC